MDSGSIEITKFELDNFGNKLNLSAFVSEISIFESIYSPFITGRMLLNDAAGLSDRIIWAGSKVLITFTSNEKVEPVTYRFVVDSIKNVESYSLDKKQTFTVEMYSEELVRAVSITTGEMFNKQSPEDMIKTILNDKIKTEKKFIYEKTSSLDSINCANLRPFQAIDKIKKRAVSRSKKSSSFMFFENQHGYNFKTVESMLADARNNQQIKEGDRNFYLDSMSHLGVENTSWRQILGYKKNVSQSYIETIINGGVSGKIFAYDINTGEHHEFTYDDRKDSPGFDINSKSVTYKRVSIDNIKKTGDNVSGVVVAPVTGIDDLERIKKEIIVKAFMTKILSNIVSINIYGDSRMTVGTPVKINIPIIDNTTSVRTSEISGGVYLISKIRHVIGPALEEYNQSCELIRTGMFE